MLSFLNWNGNQIVFFLGYSHNLLRLKEGQIFGSWFILYTDKSLFIKYPTFNHETLIKIINYKFISHIHLPMSLNQDIKKYSLKYVQCPHGGLHAG